MAVVENDIGTFIDKEKGPMGKWIAIHEYEGQLLVGVGEEYDFLSRAEALELAAAITKHFEGSE